MIKFLVFAVMSFMLFGCAMLEKTSVPEDIQLIKPGFEYTVEILDEREEGMDAFRQNYPDSSQDILTKLMQVNTIVSLQE